MTIVAKTALRGTQPKTVSETTLTASDTMTYKAKSILLLRNPTAGALSPVIDGDAGATVPVQGIGPVDVSAGFAVGSIAAGAHAAINLDDIYHYLKGAITITGGTGLVAVLLEY